MGRLYRLLTLVVLFIQIVYNVRVLPDKAEAAIEAVVSAIASPPHAAYVVSSFRVVVVVIPILQSPLLFI